MGEAIRSSCYMRGEVKGSSLLPTEDNASTISEIENLQIDSDHRSEKQNAVVMSSHEGKIPRLLGVSRNEHHSEAAFLHVM